MLLVHRSPELGGYWHVVAGGVEPGESAPEAALRELHEETGLVAELGAAAATVEYAYSLTEEPAGRRAQYGPSVVEVRVDCFTVEAPDGWEPALDREHGDHRWCAPAEAVRTLRRPETARALERLLGSPA